MSFCVLAHASRAFVHVDVKRDRTIPIVEFAGHPR